MAQNVSVSCRFRPPSKGEKAEGASIIATVDPDCTTITLNDGSGTVRDGSNKFNFDRVFDWVTPQAEVFKHTALPLVKEVFNGFNTTIFAYGQTGSGKTHTMMGQPKSEELKGIIPRLVEAIFAGIEEADEGIEFTVKLSYVEIYNERVRDLLTARSAGSDNLKIREGTHGGVYIENVVETYVNSVEQVLALMEQGQAARALAATNMNEQSSRSHSVFLLTIGQLNTQTGSKKGAKLTLVDLAGSEKVGKTGASGSVLDEAKSINKSLSALGNVINALTTSGAHIPYRDSKLTRLLSDSLGGNSKTLLIVTGSPMNTNLEETVSTMRFGTRAKLIQNKAKANTEKSVAEYKILLHQATLKLAIQQALIDALEKDVANLLACAESADPASALKIPIPELLSRNVELLKKNQELIVEPETPARPSSGLGVPSGLPPVARSPMPLGTTAGVAAALSAAANMSSPSPSPIPPAVAGSPAPLHPGAAVGSLPSVPESAPAPEEAAAPATAAPSPVPAVAAASLTTPVKARVRAPRKSIAAASAAAKAGDDSPSTSPDTSPDNSPRVGPIKSPPVVTVGLPSLAALASLGAAAATTTAAAPAATAPARKASAASSVGSLSELLLANSDLTAQLAELRQARRALEHNLEDARKETAEQVESFEAAKAKAESEVEEARQAQKAAEERAEKAQEVVAELQQLKDRLAYEKKEHALGLSLAEAARTEAQEEVARLSNKVSQLEAKLAAASAASTGASTPAVVPGDGAEVEEEPVAINMAASAPNSPAERAPRPPRMSAPPAMHTRTPSNDEHPLLKPRHQASASASDFYSSGGPGLGASPPFGLPASVSEDMSEEQYQIEALNRGLKRKCDQYVQLMMQHQTQGERVESLEQNLEEANARLREHMAASSRKIKELDEKLLAAENLCAKFLESGRYWRNERSQKQNKLAGASLAASKIAMPMHGGGAGARKLTNDLGEGLLSSAYGGTTPSGRRDSAIHLPGATIITGAPLPGTMSPPPAGINSAASSTFNSPAAAGGASAIGSPVGAGSSTRLSGSFSQSARNAMASLSSAITGKPKELPRDHMSTFF